MREGSITKRCQASHLANAEDISRLKAKDLDLFLMKSEFRPDIFEATVTVPRRMSFTDFFTGKNVGDQF